jgi:hypothetical protein
MNAKTQEHMFTLPDIFQNNDIDPDNMPAVQKLADWNDIEFTENLKNAGNDDAICKLWNKLRNSSRYIATQHKADPKDANNRIVEQVLDPGPASFEDPFKQIISTIRQRILPKTNENT